MVLTMNKIQREQINSVTTFIAKELDELTKDNPNYGLEPKPLWARFLLLVYEALSS